MTTYYTIHKRHLYKLIFSCIAFILLISVLYYAKVSAASKIIYETSTRENITSGATLEKVTRFTDNGWLGINIMRIDLTNPYIKVDTLTNSDSITKLTTTKTLAATHGALAAVNGGFFSWSSSGGGESIGPSVSSGKLVSYNESFNQTDNIMSTLSINNVGQALYSYWKDYNTGRS